MHAVQSLRCYLCKEVGVQKVIALLKCICARTRKYRSMVTKAVYIPRS